MAQLHRWIPLVAVAVLTCVLAAAPRTVANAAPAAQDATEDAVVLIPFTDEVFEIEGTRPDWEPLGNGLYGRGSSAGDVALVALQAAPTDSETVLQALLPQFGLTAAPEPSGAYTSPTLEWTLYRIIVPAGSIEIAIELGLSERDNTTYIVVLQALAEEIEPLTIAVFEPMLNDLRPLAEAPAADVAYIVEDVTFENPQAGITLAGTLTLPGDAGPYPAVVLFSGSGPQDRNERIMGTAMEPFALLADALTSAGMAVLRYDDRGVGESEGDYASADLDDLIGDARAALDYLLARPEIDLAQTGMLGHSEGAVYAAVLATEYPDLGFAILMAGLGASGEETLITQNILLFEAAGATPEEIDVQVAYVQESFPLIIAGDYDAAGQLLRNYLQTSLDALPEDERALIGDVEAYIEGVVRSQRATYFTPWFGQFLAFDPAEYWSQVSDMPVLAVFGGKDLQVEAEQATAALRAAFEAAGNDDVTFVTLPDANHLFQVAETGSIAEYSVLPAEFTPDFIPLLVEWLDDRVTLQPVEG